MAFVVGREKRDTDTEHLLACGVKSNLGPQPASAGGGGAGRLHRGRSECVYVRGCCCAHDSDSCHRIDQAGAGWLHFFFFCQRPDCDAFAGSTAG